MSKILTQEEIDALLKSARRFGGRGQTKNDPAARATKFDFKRQPDYISPDLLSALEGMHEQFAISLSSSLTLRLRSATEISLESVRTQSYSEFAYSLSDPTVVVTASMKPLEGLIVIEFNPSVAFPAIDVLLSGPGVMPNQVRPISDIQWSIFEGVIQMVLADLQHSWLSMIPTIKFEVNSRETRPYMINATQQQETVMTFTLKVKIGNSEGYMHLSLPAVALKPYLNRFSPNTATPQKLVDTESPARLADLLRQANVNIAAELRGTMLTVDELLQLRQGDILRLDQRLTTPASIAVNNSEKFVGSLGSLDGSRMMSVLEKIA